MMKRIIPVLAVLAAYLHSFPSLTHVRAYASSSVTTATTKTNLVVLSSTLIFGSSFVEGIIDPDVRSNFCYYFPVMQAHLLLYMHLWTI